MELNSMTCTHLPPVRVILVEDLQNFATVEAKASLLAGNQVIMSGVVIKVAFHKCLMAQKHKQSKLLLTQKEFVYLTPSCFFTFVKLCILIGQKVLINFLTVCCNMLTFR